MDRRGGINNANGFFSINSGGVPVARNYSIALESIGLATGYKRLSHSCSNIITRCGLRNVVIFYCEEIIVVTASNQSSITVTIDIVVFPIAPHLDAKGVLITV